MPRLAFNTQFVGTKFSGSQKQKGARSVQEELEKAFSIFFREPIKVVLASRVDAGVHARNLVGHFDLLTESYKNYTEHELCRHLNGILPSDVAILRMQEVPETFHARRNAIERSYIYRVRGYSQRFPLDESQVAYVSAKLNLKNLQEMAKILVGEHDFTGLSKPCDYKTRPTCKVIKAAWKEEKDLFSFEIAADHFLYNMVRIIVGTQICIENGKLSIHSLENALKFKDRSFAGTTAPAKGLCLEAVKYPYNLFSI